MDCADAFDMAGHWQYPGTAHGDTATSDASVPPVPEFQDPAYYDEPSPSPLCSSVLHDLMSFKRFRALRSQRTASDSPLRTCISAPADASVTLCRTMSLPLCRPTSTNTSEDACATSLPVHGQLPGHCMPATLQSLMASPSAGSSVSYPGPPRNNPFQDDDGIVHIVAPEAPADDADMQTAGDGASMPKNDLFSPGQEDGSEVSFAQLLSELASQSAEANELARRGRSFETVRGPGASAAAVGAEPKPLPSHDFVHSGYSTSDTSTMPFRTATTASVGASGALRHPCGTRSTSSARVHHSDSRSFHHKAAKGWPQRLAVPPCESPTSPLAAAPDGYFGNLKAPSLPHRSSTISTGNDFGGRRRHPNPRLMRALSSNDYETQLKWSN